MIPARRWLPLFLVLCLLGGFALVWLQDGIDLTLNNYRIEEQALYLSSGEWVKRLSLGYDGLLACIYWTRAVQHFGRERLGKQEYKILYPLLDITTTLDPQMIPAYRFGAIFLSEPPPGGPGQPEKAVTLLQKGIVRNPHFWRFWYDLGFVYYRSLKDYARSAAAFRQGATLPGADNWMEIMATKVAAEGASRETARFLWQKMYDSSDDPIVRQAAEAHLIGLNMDDQIQALQGIVDRYREKTGKPPKSFRQLAEEGWIPGQPLDPAGFPYHISSDGRVLIDPATTIITSTLGKRK